MMGTQVVARNRIAGDAFCRETGSCVKLLRDALSANEGVAKIISHEHQPNRLLPVSSLNPDQLHNGAFCRSQQKFQHDALNRLLRRDRLTGQIIWEHVQGKHWLDFAGCSMIFIFPAMHWENGHETHGEKYINAPVVLVDGVDSLDLLWSAVMIYIPPVYTRAPLI